MIAPATRRLLHLRQLAQAAERRRRLGAWLETLNLIESVKPRSPEERQAKDEAIERMMEARP